VLFEKLSKLKGYVQKVKLLYDGREEITVLLVLGKTSTRKYAGKLDKS